MKKIVILGSTGSIGRNALKTVGNLGWNVLALAAKNNDAGFIGQVRSHRPKYAAVFDHDAHAELKGVLPRGTRLLAPGVEGLTEMASLAEADVVLNSISGSVGFAPLVASIRASKHIALANKEPMVMAGEALMLEAARWQAKIIPVDSEPSAIFQCLQGLNDKDYGASVSRIFLTASGGAFYRYKGDLSKVTPARALKHPTWKMGPKITVDCATLMNKGLETIEIKNFFSLPVSRIQVLIHPQSVMHSGVEFKDGSVLAQLSWPDMKLPIQYALTYPERVKSLVAPMNFFKLKSLDFLEPDFRRFPCLKLAYEAGRLGGSYPAVLNAANEVAVDRFLKGAALFTDISVITEKTLVLHHSDRRPPTLAEAVEVDQWARIKAAEIAVQLRKKRK
ncbi:MAG: 1-deoxy-D-xylulose-5-phosphate reductoisomerase [Elusimicrobia bacterium RIFOXYA12_FULL_51_18]|nr:MAG: 1-deoxy-D-xylulose-5-phosphate reductoisomerase [Elusimicrobia bacterium RIFOXYA12_FULL_51_18]OGS29558.1 MAG: 1-deoxy-D-xylulose-5-phosphate reductoisomerase [Elusimicrobia bacterium RIFOXYA2_FULL_53_38]